MDATALQEYFPDPAVLTQVDEKGHLRDAVRDAVLRKARMKSENRTCFECTSRGPVWCSVTYGVYLCLDCSGDHRRKGVHLSFVRSVEMDKFYPDQLVQMVCGGNGKALRYFKDCGMGKSSDSGRSVDYTAKLALKYKTDLEKAVKAACDTLGVTARHEDATAVPGAGAAPTGVLAANGADSTPAQAPPAPVAAMWKVGQRMQFREKGSTWKWGFVTHCKPLKLDYKAYDEVRETASSKILDAAAQREIWLTINSTTQAAPEVALAATPARTTSQANNAPAAPQTFIIRKNNAAAPQNGHNGGATAGYAAPAAKPVAAPQIPNGYIDLDFGEAPEDSKPQPGSPKDEKIAENGLEVASVPEVANVTAAALPAKEPEKPATFEFDFDF